MKLHKTLKKQSFKMFFCQIFKTNIIRGAELKQTPQPQSCFGVRKSANLQYH